MRPATLLRAVPALTAALLPMLLVLPALPPAGRGVALAAPAPAPDLATAATDEKFRIRFKQPIEFVHRYHTTKQYAKDYGYSAAPVKPKPKGKPCRTPKTKGVRGRTRRRLRRGRRYGLYNYASRYPSWRPPRPRPKRRSKPTIVTRTRPRPRPRPRPAFPPAPRRPWKGPVYSGSSPSIKLTSTRTSSSPPVKYRKYTPMPTRMPSFAPYHETPSFDLDQDLDLGQDFGRSPGLRDHGLGQSQSYEHYYDGEDFNSYGGRGGGAGGDGGFDGVDGLDDFEGASNGNEEYEEFGNDLRSQSPDFGLIHEEFQHQFQHNVRKRPYRRRRPPVDDFSMGDSSSEYSDFADSVWSSPTAHRTLSVNTPPPGRTPSPAPDPASSRRRRPHPQLKRTHPPPTPPPHDPREDYSTRLPQGHELATRAPPPPLPFNALQVDLTTNSPAPPQFFSDDSVALHAPPPQPPPPPLWGGTGGGGGGPFARGPDPFEGLQLTTPLPPPPPPPPPPTQVASPFAQLPFNQLQPAAHRPGLQQHQLQQQLQQRQVHIPLPPPNPRPDHDIGFGEGLEDVNEGVFSKQSFGF